MATPFRDAQQLLTQYAAYHRDRRNIATHFVGVPMIMFGALLLLARPSIDIGGGLSLTPAGLALAAILPWTLSRGAFVLGSLTAGVWLVMAVLAHGLAAAGAPTLTWGALFFCAGWLVQFLGHYYEGRKPAFIDDLMGLFVAPMFVLLEALAPLGLFRGLMNEVERRAGPTLLRDLAHPAAR